MNLKPLKWFLRITVSLLFLLSTYFIWRLQNWEFPEFLDWVTQQVDNPSLTNKIQSILSKKSFSLLQKMSLLSIIPIIGVVGFIVVKEKQLLRFIKSINAETFNTVKNQFNSIQNLPKLERIILIVISLLFLIKAYWYVFNWPMQYDEAWTFNHYIKKSWFATLFAPHNNHMFYTLVAKASYHIFFFLRPIEAIRLPLPIFALGSAWMLFFFTKKLFNKQTALLTFAFFLAIGPTVFYSLYARAYMLGIFFSILFLIQTYSLSKHTKPSTQFWFVISGILAIYSIQSSVFFIAPVWLAGVLLSFNTKKKFKDFTVLSILLFIGTLLIYAPILITTKMQWLVENSSHKFNWSGEVYTILQQLGAVISGLPWYSLIPFYILISFPLFGLIKEKKERWFFILATVCMIIPILAITLKKQSIPSRVFYYLVIFLAPCYAYLITSLTNKIKLKAFFPLLAMILFFIHSFRSHHQTFFNWSNKWDNLTEELFIELKNNNINEVYNYYLYAKPALEYFSFEKDHDLAVKMTKKTSIDYASFAEKDWEAVIWWTDFKGEQPDLSGYKKTWGNRTVELYIKN